MSMPSKPVLQKIVGRIRAFGRASDEKESPDPLVFVQRFADGLPNPIFFKDARGVYRICNLAFEKLVGRPRTHILGQGASAVLPPDLASEDERTDRELWVGGGVQSYRRPFRATDGAARQGLWRKSLITGADGKPSGLIGIVTDITELLEAQETAERRENWFRALTEHALDVIVVIDREGLIRFITPSVERVLGWTSASLTGANLLAYAHPEDVQATREAIARSLTRRPGEEQLVELRFRCRDESWRTLEVIGNNCIDDPAVQGIVVNARDVTIRRRAQRELQQALVATTRLAAARTLARGVAHNVNNLMLTIEENAALLIDRTHDSDGQELLADVARAAEKAAELARQLQAYALGGRVQLRPTSLNTAVEETLTVAVDTVLRPEIGVETVLDSSLSRIEADPAQISQLVSNLVTNAAEAITGTGQITIRTSNVVLPEGDPSAPGSLASGPHVRLTIRDTGCGMDAKIVAQAFEPFFSTKFVGRGLGLSEALGIVKNQGGAISVESDPGSGSTFTVYLPALVDKISG